MAGFGHALSPEISLFLRRTHTYAKGQYSVLAVEWERTRS